MTLPDGWHEAPLGDVCRIVSGGTPKTGQTEYWGGEVAWVTPNDLSRDRSQTVFHGERSLTQAGYSASSAKLFPAGSVVVSSRAPIGYVAIAGREMSTNQGCKTAVPPDFIDSRFLYWFMLSAKPDLETRASGTTFKEISAKGFSETLLRWPDLPEQRRIVQMIEGHLSRLDAAKSSAASAERRVRALGRSASAVEFPGHGPRVTLADLISGIEAGRSFGGAGGRAGPSEWGIIKVSAMTWGTFKPEENKAIRADLADPRYEIREGDLLVSRANTSNYVGASVLVGQVRSGLLLSDKSLRLTPRSGVATEWLWRALQSPSARAQISALATGTKDSMRNISQRSLLQVRLPDHDADRQRAAVSRYREVEDAAQRLHAEVVSSQQRTVAVRAAILAAAFSGRLTGRRTDTEAIEESAQ